jgi:hypothetical protein
MSAINWASSQGGDWSTGTNWEQGFVPSSTDDTEIVVPGVYAVTITSDVSAANLIVNASGATLDESGAGSLTLSDGLSLYNGAVFLDGSNSIGSSVEVAGGLLAVGNSGALGNGVVLLYGGELLATTTENINASVAFRGTTTIAAVTGQTLTLEGGALLNGSSTLTFGASGENGTILWDPTSFQLAGASPYNLDIRSGELVFGNFDEGLTALSAAWNSVDIEAGSTLDLAGVPSSFSNLTGGGTLTGSVTSLVTIGAGQFSGDLTGDLNLNITGQVGLAGSSTIGGIQIGNGGSDTSLTIDTGGLLDLDTNSDISLSPGASNAYLVNDGTILRNDMRGSSLVSIPFFNFGAMRITTGSFTFTDGFSNSGAVEGRLTTNNDGTITWTPDPAKNNFNSDAKADILWQNTNGDVELWNSNSGSESFTGQDLGVVGGGWQIAGTGAFNEASEAGILWRNPNGNTELWNSNGSGGFTYENLGVVSTSWQIAGTGDFTGNGEDSILWRNPNGNTELWNPNGSGGFIYENLGVVSTSWQIVGTGDFSGNGQSGILWRNANGDTALWNPNGSGGFTGEDLGVVSTSWQIAGTGDFNGSGEDSILWRNANGDTALWNPNGSGGFTGKDLGVVSTAWQIVGTGDFSGDGQSGILWRNTNGDAELWNPNGSGGFTGQDLGVVGTSWSVHKIFA